MPKHPKKNSKKRISKRTVRVTLKKIKENQKFKKVAKKTIISKLKKSRDLRARQTAKQKQIRKSDAEMKARRKTFNNRRS